eukprot:TRINITY_DN2896_c0_g1_i2.p1 TRINITY_DN2896_c0_g1~~TRINITY_DN2896_c0_g1_i2.p1  ORF type:complete len:157 (+),score=15.14 TRINITY_DN2896_c0_g1_i2:352-822(+)
MMKQNASSVHYSVLVICNVEYGVKVLDVIKHKEGSGTKRDEFLGHCVRYIRPVIEEHRKKHDKKNQFLYLDRASIHRDEYNERTKAVFSGTAKVVYLPSSIHEHLTPLDHSLFGTFQRYYSSLPNSTEEEVRAAVLEAASKLTPQMVRAAALDIGY